MEHSISNRSLSETVFHYSYQGIKNQLVILSEYEANSKELQKKNSNVDVFDCLYRALNDEERFERWSFTSLCYRSSNDRFGNRNRNSTNKEEFVEYSDEISLEEEVRTLENYRPNESSSLLYLLLYSVVMFYLVDYYLDRMDVNQTYPRGLMRCCSDLKIYIVVRNIIYGHSESLRYKNGIDNEGCNKKLLQDLLFDCFELTNTKHSIVRSCYYLIGQLNIYLRLHYDKDISLDEARKYALSEMSVDAIRFCGEQLDFENTVRFFPISIRTNSIKIRQEAFSQFSRSALLCKRYQCAYDVAVSWINSHLLNVFLEENVVTKECINYVNREMSSDNERMWRKENPEKVADIYSDLVIVCRSAYDLLYESKQRDELLCFASYYASLAVSIVPNNEKYRMLAGIVCSDNKEYWESIKHFRVVYDNQNNRYRLHALRHMLLSYTMCFTEKRKKTFEKKSREYIALFHDILGKNNYYSGERILGRDLIYLLSACEYLSERNKGFKYDLIDIDKSVAVILDELRIKRFTKFEFKFRKEQFDLNTLESIDRLFQKLTKGKKYDLITREHSNRTLAYYSKMDNIKYLFKTQNDCDESDADSDGDFNRFTMMHARYMNDPEEGLVLLRELKNQLLQSPEYLRDALYDQKFVFLKSFTGLVDQLNMWAMYGGDNENGKDCNGCCVRIAPETFDRIYEYKRGSHSNDDSFINDDYHLYSVVYMKGEDLIVNNGSRDIIKKHYEIIKNKLGLIKSSFDDCDNTEDSDNDRKIVVNCLVRILGRIMFLFKDSNYQLESESRIIITRDIKDRKDIMETDQVPPKLFINPNFQVYPLEIILGPKTDNADYWIPHLQLELSKISDKWLFNEDSDYHPIVRKSNIKIR